MTTVNFSQAPADQLSVRRANLGLVLRRVRSEGAVSRARLAALTGLNKATVSSIVAELLQRRLLAEGAIDRSAAIGRPGQLVTLAEKTVMGVGAEINGDYVDVTGLDLGLGLVARRRVPVEVRSLGPDAAVAVLGEAIAAVLSEGRAAGAVPLGVTVGVPGLVRRAAGVVTWAPNFGWTDLDVEERLRYRLGEALRGVELQADNDANLGAIAEHALEGPGSVTDLVYLSAEVGVGAGIVVNGRLIRGAGGFAGEVGHLRLNPRPDACGCGQVGCWETQVGMRVLLTDCARGADDPLLVGALDVEARLDMINERALDGDERARDALRRLAAAIGAGAVAVVNMLNPAVLVLGGYFARLGPWLAPTVESVLARETIAPRGGGCRVRISGLGFSAASRGGAIVALDPVFEDPTLSPRDTAGQA